MQRYLLKKRGAFTFIEFLVTIAIIVILTILLIVAIRKAGEAAERARQQQSQPAWKYEKYFEHLGGGVYHVEGFALYSLDPPDKVETYKDFARVIADWRSRHPELRIISVTDEGGAYPSYIIVTEPAR